MTLNWETTKSLVKDGSLKALTKLVRSPEQQQIYLAHRQKMLKEYLSITDSVKIRILKYNYRLEISDPKSSEIRKQATSPSDKTTKMLLTTNEFPYNVQKDVDHDILWCQQELTDAEIEDEIKKQKAGYEAVWFRNPTELQSVPDLWHIHILSRKI